MDERKLDKLTERIIGCAYQVSNTLGVGFEEKVYENAYAHEMRKNGLNVIQQHSSKVSYDGVVVGEIFADILVEKTVLVELKAVSNLNRDHLAQALNICVLPNYLPVFSSFSDNPKSKYAVASFPGVETNESLKCLSTL